MLNVVSRLHYAVAKTQKSRLAQNPNVMMKRTSLREDCYQLSKPIYHKRHFTNYEEPCTEPKTDNISYHVNTWLKEQGIEAQAI